MHVLAEMAGGEGTVDGSAYRYNFTQNGRGYTVTDRKGISYATSISGPNGNQVDTTVVSDPAGNQITRTVSDASGDEGWTDSANRHIPGGVTQVATIPLPNQPGVSVPATVFFFPGVATTDLSKCPSGTSGAMRWDVPAYGGNASYYFCFTQITLQTNFHYQYTEPPDTHEYTAAEYTGQLSPLSAIVLPNGQKWQFSYDSYGNLTKIVLPTGATVSYTWSIYADQIQNISIQKVATRTVNANDGTGAHVWSYSYCASPCTTSVVGPDPDNNTVQHDFDPSMYEIATRWYQGPASSASLLKTTTTAYVNTSDSMGLYTAEFPTSVTTTYPNAGSSKRTLTNTFTPGSIYFNQGSENVKVPLNTGVPSASYDYGSSQPLVTQTTTFQWQRDNDYLLNNLLDLPAEVTTQDPTGNKVADTAYTYDEAAYSPYGKQGNLTTVTSWLNGGPSPQTHYGWNSFGQKTFAIDGDDNVNSNGHSTDYAFNQCGASLISDTYNALGQHTSGTYDCASGLLNSLTDANNNSTKYTYDTMGRVTSVMYPDAIASSSSTSSIGFSYDDVGLGVTKITNQAPSPQVVQQTSFDQLGRQIKAQMSSDPQGTMSVETTYDNNGQVFTVANPHRSSATTTDGSSAYYYDALGQVVAKVNHDGSAQTNCYNGIASLSYSGNCTGAVSGATNAMSIASADESGRSWTKSSDGLGRLIKVIEPGSLTTTYTYDSLSNLLSVTQSGQGADTPRLRTFVYDSLSRLISSSNPETGTICYGQISQGSCGIGYDPNGNLLYKTDARGQLTSFTYDALNRLTSKSRSGGSTDQYFYDGQVGQSASASYLGGNLVGRMSFTRSFNPDLAGSTCSTTTGKCDDQYLGYDAMGRPNHLAEAFPSEWGSGIHSTDLKYDLAGNMTDLAYPDGSTITQAFDGAGRLSSVSAGTTAQPGAPFISSITYLPSGSPQAVSYANGVTQTFTQNNRLQPCHEVASTSSLNIMDRQYFYNTNDTTSPCGNEANNNGNIWHIVDGLPSATNSQNFTYDALNRLASFEGPNMSAAYRSQRFSYDSFGNIQATNAYSNAPAGSPNVVGTPSARMFPNPNFTSSSGWPYDANNHLLDATFDCTGPNGTHYDAAGNVQCDGSNTDLNARQYTWDAESRVTRVDAQHMGNTYDPTALYTYDANGNRIRADQLDTSGNTTSFREYSFLNGLMLAEKNQAGSAAPAWTDYIYANGQKIAKVDQQKPLLHLHGVRDGSINMGCGVEGGLNGGTGYGTVIQSGDNLAFDLMQTIPTYGGLALIFTNGNGSGDVTDTGGTGQPMYFDGVGDGQWHHMQGSLSNHVGETVYYSLVGIHNSAPAGTFDMYIANAVVVHADGTVSPLFTGQSPTNVSGFAGTQCGGYDLTSGTDVTPVTDPAITKTYYLADHLGTTQIELSGGGWPVWQGQFAPFGQELDNQNTTMRFKFTGKERDAESGLDYFGARYYGSSIGRFMSPDDDSGEHADQPQSWNLYSYVQNNPITNTDPDGHDCVVQSRIDDTHESISVSSGNCAGKGTGSGQSATYVPGTVTGISVNGGNSIDIGYNSYDGQSSGVTNSRGAPAFDHPGIDGPANAAIFGQIGNNGMGAIKWFGEQMAWNVVGGVAAHGIGLGVEALQAARAARAAQAAEALAVAERVTQHAFVKHAGEFGNITRNEFQSLVQETMANPSEVRSLSNGRTAYWSDSQQMVVIENGTMPSQSTAFRPTAGKSYFDNMR